MSLYKRALLISICGGALALSAQQNAAANGGRDTSGAQQDQNSGKGELAGSTTGDLPTPNAKERVPAAADPSYLIGAQDVVSIRVWREPDLSAQAVPVRPDGKISLTLLNDVQAAGLTPMQLAQEITTGLKRYVSEPQVTVVVDAINSKRIYVVGQVARPGAYPLLPQMTVLQALSSSGGFQQYANAKKTYVLRGSEKLRFSYKDALKGQHLDRIIILQPGDTIVVP